MTLYDVLGAAPGDSDAQVRKAYVEAARRHHPDFHTGADASTRAEAERTMRDINEAWEVLGDPARRRTYDAELRAARRAAWSPGTTHPEFIPVDDDEDDAEDLAWRARMAELDDRPIAGATPPPRWQLLAPVVALALAFTAGVVGLIVNVRALLAVAVVAFLASLVGFLLTPMLEVFRANRRSG